MHITIRAARATDAAAVTALLERSYPVLMAPAYEPSVLAAALPTMTRANPALLASGTFYLAEAPGDGLVGCGGWTPERPGSGDASPALGHVRHFATHPDRTGRGIGRAVFDRCRAAAGAAGIVHLECYASLNAEPFYRALGFSTLRQADIVLAEGVRLPVVVMRRDERP